MNALELLSYLTERRVDALFRAARALPTDKLTWKPTPDSRSALDQLQEVATANDQFWPLITEGKAKWSPEIFMKWVEERSKITDLDELEQLTKASTARLLAYLRTLDPAELTRPVELPFPGGPLTLADVVSYQLWNTSYHEGQIMYIGTLTK